MNSGQKEFAADYSQEARLFAKEVDEFFPEKLKLVENAAMNNENRCYSDYSENIENFSKCMSKFKQIFDQQNRDFEYKLAYSFHRYHDCLQSIKTDDLAKQAIKCNSQAREALNSHLNKFITDLSKI